MVPSTFLVGSEAADGHQTAIGMIGSIHRMEFCLSPST